LCQSSFVTATKCHKMKQTLAFLMAFAMSMSLADQVDELSDGCELPVLHSNLLLQRKNQSLQSLDHPAEEDATTTTHAQHSDATCASKLVKIMKQVSKIEKAQHAVTLPASSPISLYVKYILLLQETQPFHFKHVIKDLKGIISGEKKFVDLPQQDRNELRHALEEIAERIDVEQAIPKEKGLIITEQCLQFLSDAQNADKDEEDTVEGDIRLPDADAVKLFEAGTKVGDLFPDPSHIPICFDPAMPENIRKIILHAAQHYTDHVPCIGFREVVPNVTERKCSVKPGIWAQHGTSNWANLGATTAWGGPTLQLVDAYLGTAVHELGHAIGVAHEQSRPDASQYIRIMWEAVQASKTDNFKTHMDADTSVPYDLMSVMHYGDTFFSKDGRKTIEPIKPDPSKVIGQRMGLSRADAQQVANMYGCPSATLDFKQCTSNLSHSGTEGDCTCHRDPNPSAERIFKATENGRSWCAPHCHIYNQASYAPCKCSVGWKYGEYAFPHVVVHYCYEDTRCNDADPIFCSKHSDACNADGNKNDPGSLYWQMRQKCSKTCDFCRKCEDMHPDCHRYKQYCADRLTWFDMEFEHVCRDTCHQCLR